MEAWLRKPLKTDFYVDGLQALLWPIEKRGLAGASKLEGIPWVMEMESFFEAWIETLFHSVARTTGGIMKAGRLRQTTRPIAWDPPYLGSQKSLIPDIWLQWGSTTLVVDAKYKRHFEELQTRSWSSIEAEWKEQHRNDLLQVLAYANLAESRTIVSCLVYPCTPTTWTYLRQSGRLFHKAEITVGTRALHLWMTAAPMKAAVDEVVAPIIEELMPVLRASE
jgi:5-methylcytosine-specific restriction endonuclease McrBC regulatory subunit McrC